MPEVPSMRPCLLCVQILCIFRCGDAPSAQMLVLLLFLEQGCADKKNTATNEQAWKARDMQRQTLTHRHVLYV
jgi:hypothetical protein